MSSPSTLPPVVRDKLTGLASRIRLARFVRGLSISLLVMLALWIVLFLADVGVAFSQADLKALFVVFVVLGAVAVGALVALPLWRTPKPEALAALIDDAYPQLEERLLSSVELCDSASSGPVLVTALMEETSTKAETVKVAQVVSLQREKRLARFAGLSLLSAIIVAVLIAPARDFSSRLFLAWFSSPPLAQETAVQPTIADPVGVTELTLKVSPPEYADAKLHPVRVLKNPDSVISALQFGRIRFDVGFDRPAALARMIVKNVKQPASCELSLSLAEENRGGYLEMPALPPGEYELGLHVEGLEKSLTKHVLPAVRIVPDEPPFFSSLQLPQTEIVAVELKPQAAKAREVAPDDVLLFNFIAEDDIGLDHVDVEFRVNNSATQNETIIQAEGQAKVAREFALSLKGRVKDGDLFLYRLKAVDNRRVPTGQFRDPVGNPAPREDLGPQQAFAPAADKWYAVRIKRGVEPLDRQDILAERDDAKNRLVALKRKLLDERGELAKIRPQARNRDELSAELKKDVQTLRAKNDSARDDSLLLAQSLGREMSLRFLAAQLFELAEDELAKSAAALDKAGATGSAEREKQFAQADQNLTRGLKRLDALLKLNDELAQYRLDRSKLAELGRRQEDLGGQAADADPKKLTAEQQRLAQEFKRLLEQSKLFKKNMESLRELDAQKLAKDAHQLARRQRELTNQAADNLQRELTDKLAPLAEKQRELAMQAGKLGEETARNLEANGLPRFYNTEAMKAAEALQKAQVSEALGQQKHTSEELSRLAKNLENAINLSRSPREAARQLAQRQDQIQKKLEQLGRDFARLPPDQLRKSLDDLTKAQQALQQAIKKLPAPPKPADVPQLWKAAEKLAGQAAEQIERDALTAFDKMGEARTALEQLAAKLPSKPEQAPKDTAADLAQRKQAEQARRLAKEQDNLRDAVEKAVKDALGAPSMAQDGEKQQKLMAETKQLAKELTGLSQSSQSTDEAKQKADDAAQSAQQSQESMSESQQQSKQGNPAPAREAGQQAAQQLDQAGVDAALAAQMFSKQKVDEAAAKTAAELQQSRQAMQQAQQDLKQGQNSSAAKAMQQAGQAMRRAAQQAAAQASSQGINTYVDQKMTKEGELLVGPSGAGLEGRNQAAKAWGDLPGELRTRILQDLRTHYGEDYGAIIQHYFQQIADVPMRKK